MTNFSIDEAEALSQDYEAWEQYCNEEAAFECWSESIKEAVKNCRLPEDPAKSDCSMDNDLRRMWRKSIQYEYKGA